MELGINERIALLQILPKEGDYLTYKILQDLKNELSFTEKEIDDWKIVISDNRMTWDVKKERKKKVNIGEKATEVIREAFKKLDKEKKINSSNIALYEKFVLSLS